MGFYYAREKQKFDAEWERLSAWYQAEGNLDWFEDEDEAWDEWEDG